MGNSKNKKVPKKRKASNTSKCSTSSDQKENVPKTQKTRNNKPDPDDGIAMSKQLLLKKKTSKLRTQSRSSSKPERICPNGKPIPSLSELEKMFEDSDDDNDDDPTSETPSKKPPCAASTPVKGTPASVSQNNLLSPSTIIKITERLLDSIQDQKLPDPSEVLEATSLLREKSPPPPPIVPPKKRKKTEIPYIVGCKDRPKVIRKPNTNFCKGDDDYGVEALSEDPEEEPHPAKRGKKSRIPKYSKSIFNAHTDEIAERLAQDDAANLSDASSDSDKTMEYEPTLFQNLRPTSFSPLPSTSRDSETFEKNDELYNESLKITEKKNDEVIDKNLKAVNINKELTTKETDEQINVSTPLKREDDVSITKKLSPRRTGGDDLQIIDIPYDTIVIDDICEVTKTKNSTIIDNSVIEIIEPAGSEVTKPKYKTEVPNDEDCMIVPNSGTNNNYKNDNLNEPIVIDDEYSNINMEFNSFIDDPIEIIDVDDIIAENNTILDKWKNSKELNMKTTYRNVTAVNTNETPNTTVQRTSTPNTTSPPNNTSTSNTTSPPNNTSTSNTTSPPNNTSTSNTTSTQRTTLPPSVSPEPILRIRLPPGFLTSGTTLQARLPLSNTLQASVPPINTLPSTSRQSRDTNQFPDFESIVDAFFNEHFNNTSQQNKTSLLLRARASGSSARTPLNKNNPVSTKTSQNGKRKESNSNNSSTTMTNVLPSSPILQRNIGDCPICLDPLNSSNGIASTICGHVFCLSCIQASVKTSGKKCPTCRKSLKGPGYHQLYL